jgi:hypothetical protein
MQSPLPSFLSEAVGCRLDALGLRAFSSPTVGCLVALLRTAFDGKLDWRRPLDQFRGANAEHVALRRVAAGVFWLRRRPGVRGSRPPAA